ncbi:restriction endonuclease subunit S [Cyclobacterium sp. 1_MG-2023]|uniref:restriction endonuclease subunit S n=1 Tax=Cyclobacterium sp. 1_MG-2023 TaxID=3062681 RepID=UPI0026E421AA|nr:restriction endonuclease subunit S [Cyclobacterium sp. 1_MG-2023]
MEWFKTIPFSDVVLWDVKRYSFEKIQSKYPIVKLGMHIQEESHKVKLADYPDEEFGILGVSNKIGIFDAYKEKGANINQSYKTMEQGWLAYNPYRVNVGSIGLRTEEHENEYISPAYVVFSCKETLLPDFLFKLFKTERFNKVINASTTGSVRQNLTIDILKSLDIPLPPIDVQQKMLDEYYVKDEKAREDLESANSILNKLEDSLNELIGIEINDNPLSDGKLFQIIQFKSLEKWGVDAQNLTSVSYTRKFPVSKLSSLCNVSSGGTPSRKQEEYYKGEIPWIKTGEVVNDYIFDTEEKITEEAILNSSARIYPKGSLIIAMYGQGQTRGRTAKLGVDASTNQACAVLHEIRNEVILTDYLWVYLINEYHRMRELASGNNQPNLNAEMIKNYKVVVPPIAIQQQIIKHYQSEKSKISFLKTESTNKLLQSLNQFEQNIFD